MTGMKMTAIPYKGAADAVQEIVAGRLDLFIGPPVVVMPLFEAKKVKVLAVTGTERLSSAPDVPTLTESGIPLVAFAWLGICAGAGTPKPVIDFLNSKIVPIINSKDYRALIEKSGSIPISSNSARDAGSHQRHREGCRSHHRRISSPRGLIQFVG